MEKERGSVAARKPVTMTTERCLNKEINKLRQKT
jgi:hypothetical protein